MAIGGTLIHRGVSYFIYLHEVKNFLAWYLISPLHKEDLATRVTGEEPKYPVLDRDSVTKLKKGEKIPEDYILEAVYKSKSKGTLKTYGGTFILKEVLDVVSMSMAYKFGDQNIVTDNSFNTRGVLGKDFEALDETLSLTYSRRDKKYIKI